MNLNIYIIDSEKKLKFREELKKYNSQKEYEREIKNFKFKFWYDKSEDKELNWKWILEKFDIENINFITSPKGILQIINEKYMYAITFGSAHHNVEKFCDKNFSIKFLERIKIKKTKTSAQINVSSQKNKSINSYSGLTQPTFSYGEAFLKLKVDILEEDRLNKKINQNLEIGSSIKISLKNYDLEDIIEVIEHIENITNRKYILNKIPYFKEIKDGEIIVELNEKIKDEINNSNNVKIYTPEFEIIGTQEFFLNTNSSFKLISNNKSETLDDLSIENIVEFKEKNDIDDILKIKIKIIKDEITFKSYGVFELMEYNLEEKNIILYNGKWYEYNRNFIEYTDERIQDIEINYDSKFDLLKSEYQEFINKKIEEAKSNEIYNDTDISKIEKKIKRIYYKENYFNINLEQKHNYKNIDRVLENVDKHKYEVADSYNENTIYSVKIGDSSGKLCYVVDQSILGLEHVYEKNKKIVINNESYDIKYVCIWIILPQSKRDTIFDEKTSKIDLCNLKLLNLKIKLNNWMSTVRDKGLIPIIKINFSDFD